MSTKPCNIYSEQLLTAGFWITEPHKLPGDRGIFLGDVGWLRDGQFHPLFNTMKAADDPINRDGVPRGFESVYPESQSKLLIRKSCMTMGSFHVTAGSMAYEGTAVFCGALPPAGHAECRAIAGVEFRCLGGSGAFMVIDSPAISDDNHSKLWILEYMRENLDSWLEFANTRLNLGLDEQDIVFVSRTVKAKRWAMGASAGKECCGDLEERCVAEHPSSPEDGCPRFAGRPFPVSHSGAGPAGASSDVPDQPECLSIDYYKMKRSTSGSEEPAKRTSSPCEPKYEVEPEESLRGDPGYDPVGPVLDYILQNSDATIAIASNGDVTELLQGNVKTFPNSKHIPQAIRWITATITVDRHGVGTIHCPSRHTEGVVSVYRRWTLPFFQFHMTCPHKFGPRRIACRLVWRWQAAARKLLFTV
ncbi:hypothetical protein LXA43DRAFT_41698 [Ganoderma leucocontextum]|nr:hypothetical protein LXA43DRAFT_41698 [Ganoderma leucocontextum]